MGKSKDLIEEVAAIIGELENKVDSQYKQLSEKIEKQALEIKQLKCEHDMVIDCWINANLYGTKGRLHTYRNQ